MPLLNSAFSRKATFFMCLGPLRFPLPGFFSTPGGIIIVDTSKESHKIRNWTSFDPFLNHQINMVWG